MVSYERTIALDKRDIAVNGREVLLRVTHD